MVNAWHLRQDGKFFPVQVHLYAMGDGDLSSEAEVASFLLKTDSEDHIKTSYYSMYKPTTLFCVVGIFAF